MVNDFYKYFKVWEHYIVGDKQFYETNIKKYKISIFYKMFVLTFFNNFLIKKVIIVERDSETGSLIKLASSCNEELGSLLFDIEIYKFIYEHQHVHVSRHPISRNTLWIWSLDYLIDFVYC